MTAQAAEEEGQGQEGQGKEAAPPAEAEEAPGEHQQAVEAPGEHQQQMCGQKKQQLRESECGSQQGDAQGEATAQEQTHTVATQ